MPKVVIDFFPHSARRYGAGWTVVAVDVFRATTTACTAVAMGRRCFPAATAAEARRRAHDMNALLAGELGGASVDGFDLGNSPADLAARHDVERPVVLLSSSGTALIRAASDAGEVYAACLRNTTAQAYRLRRRAAQVALIGAGSRGEVRMEDELACARVAEALIGWGFTPDPETAAAVTRWSRVPADVCASGRSAAYLRATGQERDIDFVLHRIEDLDRVYVMRSGELVAEES